MDPRENLERALDLLRHLNRQAHEQEGMNGLQDRQQEDAGGLTDAACLRLLGLVQVEVNQLKKRFRMGELPSRVAAPKQRSFSSLGGQERLQKRAEKENRSRIKAEFQQELQNLGAFAAMNSRGVQNEDVQWALQLLGAKVTDHENELKALYRYHVKQTHPDLARVQMAATQKISFDDLTKAWGILKKHNLVN